MRLVSFFLLPALLLSGCAESPPPDVEIGSMVDGEQDPATTTPKEPEAPPAPGALRLRADGTLSFEAPTAAQPEEHRFNSFAGNFQLGMYDGYVAQGAPLPHALHITAADIVVHYRHDAPGANPYDPLGYPEFAFLLGTEISTMPFIFLQGDPVGDMDARRSLEGEVPLPEGGLVLPQGSQPLVWGGSTFSQPDAVGGTVMLMDHNETDTRIDVTAAWIELPAQERDMVLDETGTLTGDGCTQRTDGQTHIEHPVDVPEDAVSLRATLEHTGGIALAGDDLDLRILGPDGSEVASSHTPGSTEVVDLYAPNLDAVGPGTWTAIVNSCALQQASYRLTVEIGTAPDVLLGAQQLEEAPAHRS